AEFVEIVVRGGVFVAGGLLHRAGAGDRAGAARQRSQLARALRALRMGIAHGPGSACRRRSQQPLPALQISRTRRDFAAVRVDETVLAGANDHGSHSWKESGRDGNRARWGIGRVIPRSLTGSASRWRGWVRNG